MASDTFVRRLIDQLRAPEILASPFYSDRAHDLAVALEKLLTLPEARR